MTCVIGLAHEGVVHIGADAMAYTSASDGYSVRQPKVFIRDGSANSARIIIGYTWSFRFGQILEHTWTPPTIPEADALDRFMRTQFVLSVKDALYRACWVPKKDVDGPVALIGIHGRLFNLYNDYCVLESTDPFEACGCGAHAARAAMWCLSDLAPIARIERALEAVERTMPGVRAPFTVRSAA